MKWDLSSDVGLDAALCYFEAKHDPELAQQLAVFFNQRLKDADVVTIQEPLFIRYFRIVMGRMCDDTDELHQPRKRMTPEQAFGFKLTRGKYEREDTESRDIRSAAYVIWALRKECQEKKEKKEKEEKEGRKRKGHKDKVPETTGLLKACGEAANRFYGAEGGDVAVKYAYFKYRDTFESFTNEVLERVFA